MYVLVLESCLHICELPILEARHLIGDGIIFLLLAFSYDILVASWIPQIYISGYL